MYKSKMICQKGPFKICAAFIVKELNINLLVKLAD